MQNWLFPADSHNFLTISIVINEKNNLQGKYKYKYADLTTWSTASKGEV